jgi:hypothetical protein
MIIKILGSGCKKCVTLTDNTKAALRDLGLTAEVSTPALVIDDKVVSVGKVLSSAEVAALLKA